MILEGKYNSAKVYTDNIDNETISQIINLCNQKAFENSSIKIMPDCHAGKGCTVGTTMTITDKVVPNLVGVDIGCGVAAVKINDKLDLDKLDKVIRTYIPHGFNVHERSREKLLKEVFNIDLKSIKANINVDRAFVSLGTLGGGNHFIEVDKTENGEMYLIVHTGSRNLGKQIAEYHQAQAIKHCEKKYGRDLSSHIIAALVAKGQQHLIEETLKAHKAANKKPSDDLCYLEGELMKNYLHDMDIAQRYAAANRAVILADILYNYYEEKGAFSHYLKSIYGDMIECIHNYIDIENNILRKGAISAKEGELVLVPINMRDGIILGRGKGNTEWNYSAPHGAGRILSRGQAKQKITLDEFKDSMKDVYTTCVGQSTLDEAPQAYKPIEDILAYIDKTLEIIDIMKPVYNFKSN